MVFKDDDERGDVVHGEFGHGFCEDFRDCWADVVEAGFAVVVALPEGLDDCLVGQFVEDTVRAHDNEIVDLWHYLKVSYLGFGNENLWVAPVFL
jgi:hypothetical protein